MELDHRCVRLLLEHFWWNYLKFADPSSLTHVLIIPGSWMLLQPSKLVSHIWSAALSGTSLGWVRLRYGLACLNNNQEHSLMNLESAGLSCHKSANGPKPGWADFLAAKTCGWSYLRRLTAISSFSLSLTPLANMARTKKSGARYQRWILMLQITELRVNMTVTLQVIPKLKVVLYLGAITASSPLRKYLP